jgi:hypothetical protein
VLLGDGHARFPERKRFVVPANTDGSDTLGDLAVADFNLDGKRDLTVLETGLDEPGIWVLTGDGVGNFTTARQYRTAGDARAIAIADFNRDGNPDLAVTRAGQDTRHGSNPGAVVIRFGDGTGAFPRAEIHRGVGHDPVSIAICHCNGDRKPDLAVVNGFQVFVLNAKRPDVRVLLGDGRGGFLRPKRYRAGKSLGSIAVADFNRDRKSDLAVASAVGRVGGQRVIRVFLGDGRGGFSAAGRFAMHSRDSGAIVAADINRDRKPEIIVGKGYENGVSVLLNRTRRRASLSK